MRSASRPSFRTGALLFAVLMLLADVSGGLLSNPVHATPVADYEEPILVDGLPPLMCGEEMCERPTRLTRPVVARVRARP